jgi:hypothetical protein
MAEGIIEWAVRRHRGGVADRVPLQRRADWLVWAAWVLFPASPPAAEA